MQFDHSHHPDLETALALQWLETDGVGGYASSSILTCPTSRYHGLLVAPLPGTAKRHCFLSRFEETLSASGRTFGISMVSSRGHFTEVGHHFFERFELAPYPRFVYHIGDAHVTRELLMVAGQPTVLCRYRMDGHTGVVNLSLRPLMPCREADGLTYENPWLDDRRTDLDGGASWQPYAALPPVSITVSGGTRATDFEPGSRWLRHVDYAEDGRRGYQDHEDQWSPGAFRVPIVAGEDVVVAATIGEPVADPAALWASESARREAVANGTEQGATDDLRARLELAADRFLYRDQTDRPGVIAGFPWFLEWGRDTFIALPGLTLARGRVEECGEVLSSVTPFLSGGRVPNVFGTDIASSAYNSLDAALWYGRAALLYDQAGGSRERLMDEIFPTLVEIANAHRHATSEELTCDASGLLTIGASLGGATWMDACGADGAITPRDGQPVDVNALWYSLVEYVGKLSRTAGDTKAHRDWMGLKRRIGESFMSRFWLPDRRFLADRITLEGEVDESIRPNMVLAAALEYSPLTKAHRARIIEVARADLLTPRGLRTLSPREPGYRGRYGGDQETRDAAYHQGTVWPWLLGFYCEAALRAFGRKKSTLDRVREILDQFSGHLWEHGVGQISEVFDGDPPHRSGGTFAQAWSVSELLRAYHALDQGAR